MIVLCPKAFAGPDPQYERIFLRYFLIKTKQKAYVTNEVWDAWRFRVLKTFGEEKGEVVIAEHRGLFRPEETRLDPNTFKEILPSDKDEITLITTTKSFVMRKWADIDFFITSDKGQYPDVQKIECYSLTEFFLKIQSMPDYRQLMNDFSLYFAEKREIGD